MTLNVNGSILEGVRVASGNNQFTFPPRSIVTDQSQFDAIKLYSEYCVWVSGQLSGESGIDIGSSNLKFNWTKNENTLSRFDYDSYARRWSPKIGSSPEVIGKFGNSPRLKVTVPDASISFADAPYQVFIGYPTRIITFNIQLVSDPGVFGDPTSGNVELSLSDGSLNFGSSDLSNLTYQSSSVYFSRQSFFDRSKSKGVFGQLPSSSSILSYFFINPIPGTGQKPRIRIGYETYLTAIGFATEASMTEPPSGSVSFSYDTGRVIFSNVDIDSHSNEYVYYDGIINGTVELTKTTVGSASLFYPNPCGIFSGFISVQDQSRYVLFLDSGSGTRYYLSPVYYDSSVNSLPSAPVSGSVIIDTFSGNVYVSQDDGAQFPSYSVKVVDTYLNIESGVSIQLYRSPVNSSGQEVELDFKELYSVYGQVLQDGINSPFVSLPTIPIDDSTLKYSVTAAPGGGTFVGDLKVGSDSTQQGLGYTLDLDSKQVKFSDRKTITTTLDKATSSIKLNDSAISPLGFEVERNDAPITPGVDFEFNQNGGLIEFIDRVGASPNNKYNIAGSVTLPNKFTSPESVFGLNSIGAYIFIKSGVNIGAYEISTVISDVEVSLKRNFISSSSVVADLVYDSEVILDRVFAPIQHQYKDISVLKSSSLDGPFTTLTASEFSVITETGQISLVNPSDPNSVYKISYTWLQTDDNVTYTPTLVTEFAAFKIRQEVCSTQPGTGVIHFNVDGKTVDTNFPITLYIDGVTIDPSNFIFQAPGTITVPNSLTNEDVLVNYYVNESPGGNRVFTLSKNPIRIDYPQLKTSGSSIFNGDLTSIIKNGSAIVVDDSLVYLVQSVSYDSGSDQTSVTLASNPSADTGSLPIKVCNTISNNYMITETLASDVVSRGTNTLTILGFSEYPKNTIIKLDDDPYIVLSSAYNATSGKTVVTLGSKAIRNYILPVITKTVRPVYDQVTALNTKRSASLNYSFDLFVGGTTPRSLKKDVDYTVSDGGSIQLNFQIQYGDEIYAFYTARSVQPVGTKYKFNYSYLIQPNSGNGLLGQRLTSTYNLYSPDTFFCRAMPVSSFIPEVVDELKTAASSGSSGPNIQSRTSLKTKDQGVPSLYFEEQHLGNVDIVVRRLLKFYNDFINQYEDLLSNFDGRIVGGIDGKFRYSDNSTIVSSYSEITNDIDDRVKLYDYLSLTDFTPFTFTSIPVYSYMYEYNSLSRLFPTFNPFVTVALNDKTTPVTDYMQTMGSTGINNINSVSTMTTSRAVAFFTSATISGPDTVFSTDENGNTTKLIPPFSAGQRVFIYNSDGSLVNNTYLTISSVTGTGPYYITVAGVTYSDSYGTLVQDTSDSTVPSNHFYTPGRDLLVESDSGQVKNISFPLPLGTLQVPISGNELVDCSISYLNSSVSPKRIPVLDGSVLRDNGRVSIPSLNRIKESEQWLLNQELDLLNKINTGTVPVANTVNITSAVLYSIGDKVIFLNGPNAGVERTISVSVSPISFQVSSPFPFTDLVSRDFHISGPNGNIVSILESEKDVLNDNVYAPATPPSLVGIFDSEIKTIDAVIRGFGKEVVSSSGSALSLNVLTDSSVDFTQTNPPVGISFYLYVTSSSAMGLYKISSVTAHTITVTATSTFPSLPMGGPYSYIIIQPWGFVSEKEIEFASEFLSNTNSFYLSTLTWSGSISASGVSARRSVVNDRKSKLDVFLNKIQGLLGTNDKLYNTRFLWIQQRTDKKTGTLSKLTAAQAQRITNQEQLTTNLQKLLIAESLN